MPPLRADKSIDAGGGLVLPTWCDSHTYCLRWVTRTRILDETSRKKLPRNRISRWRHSQFSKKLRDTDEETLFQSALERLNEVIFLWNRSH